jgi:hypothetical protein
MLVPLSSNEFHEPMADENWRDNGKLQTPGVKWDYCELNQ